LKIIKVHDSKHAIGKAFELSRDFLKNEKKLNICLTGGRFGEKFSNFLINHNSLIVNKNFYLTDERISKLIWEKNGEIVLKKLIKNKNFVNCNFINFEISTKKNKNYFDELKIFDLVFMSLGEDGHLAGHFPTSNNIDKKICFTDRASSKPQKRISFRLDFLMEAKRVILIVLGKEKENALISLLKGNSFHSKNILKRFKEFFIITNIDNIS
tara:strand:- start:283 stop:918 length:636 start_codon:yes stop_codon:yes gene_type:complete